MMYVNFMDTTIQILLLDDKCGKNKLSYDKCDKKYLSYNKCDNNDLICFIYIYIGLFFIKVTSFMVQQL